MLHAYYNLFFIFLTNYLHLCCCNGSEDTEAPYLPFLNITFMMNVVKMIFSLISKLITYKLLDYHEIQLVRYCCYVYLMFLFWDRRPGEDSDGDFRDSSSDGSSDCEQDRGCMSFLRDQHPTGDVASRMAHLSLQHQQNALQEGFSSDEGEPGSSQGCLLFEYLERDPPFGREPLASKVSHCFWVSIANFLLGMPVFLFCIFFLLVWE